MRPEFRPKSVLFDCDGVIVDSEMPMMQLLHHDLLDFGVDMSFEEMTSRNLGGAVPQFANWFASLGVALPDDWVEDFYRRLYAILAEETPLIDGIVDVLDRLDEAGISYGIGSNGRHEKMDITLGQHAGLKDRFDGRIYSGQALGKLKPSPDLYLHMVADFGLQPSECVVVEDSHTGARAARAGGIPCLGFAAHDDGARLAAEGAVVFHAMKDLPGLLGL